MKNRILYLLIVGVLLLGACQPAPTPTPAETPTPETTPTPEPTETPTESPTPTLTPTPEPTPTPTEIPVVFEPVVALEVLVDDLTSPVAVKEPDDGSGRLFIVDQIGLIYILGEDGEILDTPFLDLRDNLIFLFGEYDERGLIGLAFHPEFAENGRFFVYYSAPPRPEAPADWDNTSTLSEFRVSEDDPDIADLDSERIILEVDQPHHWHNAGSIAFGPDGYLYIPLGDGGTGGDSGPGHVDDWYEVNDGGNAQNVEANMLGSILRIDINNGDPYAIPEDNPGLSENYPEIWAHGLRNPYGMAFDQGGDHELFVGDVGEHLFESVYIIEGGGNYGWNVREGSHCFSTAEPSNPYAIEECPDEDTTGNPFIDPIIEYYHLLHPEGGLGTAVIGGVVYRGQALQSWDGRYIFGDYSVGTQTQEPALFAATRMDDGTWDFERIEVIHDLFAQRLEFLHSIDQDLSGEVYVLTSLERGPTGNTGHVYRIIPPPQEDE